MKSIENILVVMDSSSEHHAALIQGIKVAQKTSASIKLFLVAYNRQFVSHWNFNQTQLDSLKNDYLASQRTWLEAFVPDIEALNIKVEVNVVWHADVSSAILAEVSTSNISMVIKSTKKDSLINKVFFTPNDWQLLEHCNVPLLLTKNISDYSYQKIMAAVNPDISHDQADDLDVDIVEAAQEIAKIYNGTAHVCHCYEPIDIKLWQSLNSADLAQELVDENFNDYSNATKKHHKIVFDKLLSNFNFDDECMHLIPGIPKDELPLFAKEEKVDLFVMGMNNNGKFIGNTIEEVLGHIDCDILSIRSKDNVD
ncbi:universal stress protein [Colwellia sp. E2M01]|uniref:universal stress protein n=1 Tax=Colwellia sp. E2M01 TaxID=2841561 RepID=UPI001C09C938|nr:universal stress protein [Colwellia sp. E2M01]MBU2870166.1 universal stress protein [Colwellia sp. E2M01]